MTETPEPFAVPNDILHEVQDRIAKLGKRAARMGVQAPVLHTHGPTVIDMGYNDEDGTRLLYEATLVSIEFSAMFPDQKWTLVANISNEGGVRTVMTIPDTPYAVPAGLWEPGPLSCDHCGKVRNRNTSYFVANTTNDKRALVGSSCMAEYLGIDAERIAQTMVDCALLSEWRPDAEDYARCVRAWDLADVLRAADEAIARWGWVSGNQAYNEGCTATKTNVRELLENTKTIRREIAEMDLAGFTWKPMDATEFDVIVAWASSGAVDGDYGRNLQAIATAGIVTNRTLGTAVSLVPTWKREQLRDMERKAAARVPSTWVEGELKQRVTLTLTLKNVAVYPNDFGYSYVHRFLTPDGKRVVWSASREQDLTIGQTIVAQASIKAKEVDQYGPVTKVLRLTIKETVSAA